MRVAWMISIVTLAVIGVALIAIGEWTGLAMIATAMWSVWTGARRVR